MIRRIARQMGLSRKAVSRYLNAEEFDRQLPGQRAVPAGRGRPGTVGPPLPGVGLRLLDEHGKRIETADGETIGEIAVRGPNLFSGYLNRPDATAAALRDGWFLTGDLATQAPDGFVSILGRKSTDLIKTGGFKVGAGEIESALLEHPAVEEAAVTGEPDDEAAPATGGPLARERRNREVRLAGSHRLHERPDRLRRVLEVRVHEEGRRPRPDPSHTLERSHPAEAARQGLRLALVACVPDDLGATFPGDPGRRVLHPDDVLQLRQLRHRLDRHVDDRARRNIVDDDRDADGIVDRLEMAIEAALVRLVVIGGDHENGVGAGRLGMAGELNRLDRVVRPGAGDDGSSATDPGSRCGRR